MTKKVSWCLFGFLLINNVLLNDVIASSSSDYLPGLSIALQHETVSDTVDYSPNLQAGGFANAVQKPRFQSQGFSLSYSADRYSRFHLTLAQRQMNSLRDAFVINTLSGGYKKRIRPTKTTRYELSFGVDASINHASEIYKNSYTNYSDHLITEVRLVEPRDARVSFSADIDMSLTDRIGLKLSIGGGLSQTSQSEVVGSARLDNNCQFSFNASTQGGSVRQLEQCGKLVSFEQYYPSNRTLNDKLGFSVADDVSYRDYFFGPQISLHWKKGSWSAGAGYEFRQYFRPTLDHRIRQSGDSPVSKSHSAYARTGVRLMMNWELSARISYQRAAFLDDIPFLYTALTHDRYRGNGVIRYAFNLTRFFN